MSSLKAVLIAAGFAIFLLLVMSSINFAIDPMCYYSCDDVAVDRPTSNSYYHAAQKIVANPDAEQILLGSSRAGTTSPYHLQKVTGIKTLNLEVPGAELMAKLALMRLALERNKLKRVIWYADYFELINENIDEKLKSSRALRKFVDRELATAKNSGGVSPLISLIDQSTLVASVHSLKVKPLQLAKELGGNSGEYLPCDRGPYEGKESVASLNKKVGLLYENYSQKILKPLPSSDALSFFIESMRDLETRGIEVVIVIIPYHPDFMSRLTKEFPAIADRQVDWAKSVSALASSKIRVLDYLSGIPGGDSSPKFWNDGVHFTCNGSIAMLRNL